MKRILMIGTGGTIASKQTEYGLAPRLTSEELLSYIPQIRAICEVDSIQLFNVDSTNIIPKHWESLVICIEKNYDDYDGFLICHGTDTLAYTAAALSYMIQNSRKPIVITGAQKPIQMEITDAKTNLLDSFIYVTDEKSQNVSVVFDGKVIAGTRARKECAKSYHAFTSLNFPYLAVIQDGMLVRYIEEKVLLEPVSFYHRMDENVYVLKLIPGLRADLVSCLLEQYDCLIIESFGVGGLPDALAQVFYRSLNDWKTRGKCIVMTTQVVNEGSNMTVYEVGRRIKQDLGFMEAHDMTLESVITKMMWIMADGIQDYEQRKRHFYKEINHDILFNRRFQ